MILRKLACGKKRRVILHTSELSKFKSRLAVRKFLKKVRVKKKVIIVSNILGIMIFFSGLKNAN